MVCRDNSNHKQMLLRITNANGIHAHGSIHRTNHMAKHVALTVLSLLHAAAVITGAMMNVVASSTVTTNASAELALPKSSMGRWIGVWEQEVLDLLDYEGTYTSTDHSVNKHLSAQSDTISGHEWHFAYTFKDDNMRWYAGTIEITSRCVYK